MEMANEVAPPRLVGFDEVTPVYVLRAPVSNRLVTNATLVCAGIGLSVSPGAPVSVVLKPRTPTPRASFYVNRATYI